MDWFYWALKDFSEFSNCHMNYPWIINLTKVQSWYGVIQNLMRGFSVVWLKSYNNNNNNVWLGDSLIRVIFREVLKIEKDKKKCQTIKIPTTKMSYIKDLNDRKELLKKLQN